MFSTALLNRYMYACTQKNVPVGLNSQSARTVSAGNTQQYLRNVQLDRNVTIVEHIKDTD